MSYVPDVFGTNRRQVESLAALAGAGRDQLDATYLTLTANVVTAAIFTEAGLRAQIAATERVIELEREALSVLRRELELGAIAEGDVYAQEAALAQIETTLPPLNRQLHQTRDSLAALTGQLPADMKPCASNSTSCIAAALGNLPHQQRLELYGRAGGGDLLGQFGRPGRRCSCLRR